MISMNGSSALLWHGDPGTGSEHQAVCPACMCHQQHTEGLLHLGIAEVLRLDLHTLERKIAEITGCSLLPAKSLRLKVMLQSFEEVQAALAEFKSKYSLSKVGAQGFCWGGKYTVLALGRVSQHAYAY